MPADQLSTTFAALADPTRRAILARLASGECSVTELAEPFDMSMPAVSKHLRVLERAGLIARGREAQWRPVPDRGRPRSKKWPTGPSAIGTSGKRASIGSTTTCKELKAKEKKHGRQQRRK